MTDDEEFEALCWLKESGHDVKAELTALHGRRHQEGLREDAEFEEVVGPMRDEFIIGTQIMYRGRSAPEDRRLSASLHRFDCKTGTMVWADGRIDQAD